MSFDDSKLDSASSFSTKNSQRLRRALVAIGIPVLLIFLAPTILAKVGRGWVENRLSEETGFKLQIGSISTGWFSPVVVDEIQAETNSSEKVASVRRVETEKTLLALIFKGKEVGGISIDAPEVNVPLKGSLAKELRQALQKIDPRSGLLGKIVDPDQPAVLQINISKGQVNLRPEPSDEWATVVQGLSAIINVDHRPELDRISATVKETSLNLTPELSDQGLKFIAPILAGAVDLDGDALIEISMFEIEPQNWKEMSLVGELKLREANADIEAPLIRSIAKVFKKEDENFPPEDAVADQPLIVKFAQDNRIAFSVSEGIVHHEGVSFGLPDLLPNVKLTSKGNVSLMDALDFEVALTLPFENMSDGPLLQKIGTPSLKVPVKGTFAEPDVGIGKGKMMGGLVKDVVESISDGQVDIEPLLEKLRDSELFKRRQKKSSEEEASADATNPPRKREGILKRLRKRRQGGDEDSAIDETGVDSFPESTRR